MPRPLLAITIGDPAGVGPELALRCASDLDVLACCVPLLFGDLSVLRQVSSQLGIALPDQTVPITEVTDCIDASEPTIVDFGGTLPNLRGGKVDATTGRASFNYVEAAIDAAMAGTVHGIVTGPIQKEAWSAAGIEFPGHTELLTQRSGASESCMMLTCDEISCSLVTIHVGLAEVADLITTEAVERTIRITHTAIAKTKERPRIVVCGLNPHAGEGGMFGRGEEERIIQPAVEACRREGVDIVGPISADTAFVPDMRQQTDAYVCMYHDQGLIPLKTLAFDRSVNVTLGLPIVRTSVDHGTALDIAWTGQASTESMLAAIRKAVTLAGFGN